MNRLKQALKNMLHPFYGGALIGMILGYIIITNWLVILIAPIGWFTFEYITVLTTKEVKQ